MAYLRCLVEMPTQFSAYYDDGNIESRTALKKDRENLLGRFPGSQAGFSVHNVKGLNSHDQ